MSEEPEVDFSKLSIDERCGHKNWKARLSGYESLTNLFQSIDDEKSGEFGKYAPNVKKFVIDSNAAAQEKGLSAVLAFVENYAFAGKYVEGVISGIISKCLISPKIKTRELSYEIVLMYVEIEKQDAVIEELIKGLDNKTPKIVAASAGLIRECLNKYGIKVILVKTIIKIVSRLLEDRDKNVRDEGKQLCIEIYRWVKDAIKPQLQNLKPVQLQELETEFEKVKSEKAIPTRYLRSQMVKVQQDSQDDEVDGNASSAPKQEEEAVDPFDLLEPVDIITLLPNDFYDLCEAKKWQERKESLEKLQEIIEKNPKLASGDYSDLVRQLKKMISKDTNVMIVAIAAKCLAGLATGLRKAFYPYANSSISVIIEKFKEKKQNVVQALREAIDACIISTSIEAILEDIVAALDNKNPQIKTETALFLVRTFAKTHPNVLSNKKLLKQLCASLMKSLNDMDSTVRDASAEALGTAMKVVSEKTITPFIQGIEAIKLTKVKEFYDKAEVKTPATAVANTVANAKPPAVKRVPKYEAPVPKSVSSQESLAESNEEIQEESKPKPPNRKAGAAKSATEKSRLTAQPKQVNGQSGRSASASNLIDQSEAKQTNKSKLAAKNKNRHSIVPTSATSKKEENAVTSPLMPLNKLKEQRLADEKALKVLKWNFTAPREEFYVQLKEQMITAEWQMILVNNCFHSDFKFHIKAIDSIKDYLANGNIDATIANSDLILKWIALRFFDTNPSVILKALEYLVLIFDAYHSNSNSLSDSEANSFIPYLVLKSGDPKDAVRNKVHEITTKLRDIYHPSKIFNHLMTGLQSKNSRQRTTCLDELANLIETCGMSVCQSNFSTIKEIAKFIADRDNGVRNAALNCVVHVYFLEGEKVFKHVGQLSDKELSLLEERIKRASKTRAPVAPPQTAPPAVNNTKQEKSPPVVSPQDKYETPSPQNQTLQNNNANNATITRMSYSSKSATQLRPKSITPIAPLTLDFEQIEEIGSSGKKERRFSPKTTPLSSRLKDYHQNNENDIDIDEILNLPDVKIRRSITQPSVGPMTKMINSSPKADVALNLVMAQLSSQEISSAMEALSQLSNLLDNEAKCQTILDSKVDQLIIMCYMQYRLFITKHLADESIPKSDVVNLFRGVTNVLMALFSNQSLGKKASRDVLRELISHMISLLVDSKLTELSESSNIIRSVNLLANTVITGSDATNMLSSLIKLLHDCISGSINASPKFNEMIMKCLWKMSKNLETFISTVDIDRILFEVHLFLKSFPSIWWKETNKNDVPLRTIKTLTYLIVQLKGESVLNHLTLIQDRNESELYHYIQKALKQNDKIVSSDARNSQKVSPKLSKAAHSQLVAIITKLGTDDNESAFRELYEFTRQYPQISLDAYLEKSSDFFKGFVYNGLQKIKSEKENIQSENKMSETNGVNCNAGSSTLSKEVSNPFRRLGRVPQPQTHKEAIDWLKLAASNLGLDANKYNNPDVVSQLTNNDAINSIEAAEIAVQKAQETLEKFKLAYGLQKR